MTPADMAYTQRQAAAALGTSALPCSTEPILTTTKWMSNHPNRSAGHPARNPSPCEIRAAREAAGLTQAQAAALLHASARNWQQWEQQEGANVRRMHPGLWELFRIKTTASLPTPTRQTDRGMTAAQEKGEES